MLTLAGRWRCVRLVGSVEYTNFKICSVNEETEYSLYFSQVALFLNESGRSTRRLRKGHDWDISKSDRTIRLYTVGATKVRVRAYRYPQEIVNDTDFVEIPANALVEYAASQVLLAGLPPRGQDTSGISSQFGPSFNAGQVDLSQIPVPATSYLIGATTRVVSEDISVRMINEAFTVGFIATATDPHLPTQEGVLNDTLTVLLPLEARYLSIEWEEGDVVSSIEIDDYDQTDAFEIVGNRAISRAPLLVRPDADSIEIKLGS